MILIMADDDGWTRVMDYDNADEWCMNGLMMMMIDGAADG